VTVVDIPAYLERIAYLGPTDPTTATLRAIHRAHLFTVPFENLDIALAHEIVTDESKILNKIVGRRRGGFCYELNGAFAALLRELGFTVTLLSARVARPNDSEGPDFDHLALRVDLEESWLVDVGFGESFLEPLYFKAETEQVDPAGTFRLVRDADRWYMQRAEPGGVWKPQYSFSMQSRQFEEFAGMCHYHQTSPESHFTQNSICSRATPEGRITVSGMKLIVTAHGQRKERTLASQEEWTATLREEFGIQL